MTFLRFLAFIFYWARLELVALQQPQIPLVVTRDRGRWRVIFGEAGGTGREAWCAIRHLLEGREESEPLEFSPEALLKTAQELEAAQEHARELEAAREREREDLEDLGALASVETSGEDADVLGFDTIDTGAGDVAGDLEEARTDG